MWLVSCMPGGRMRWHRLVSRRRNDITLTTVRAIFITAFFFPKQFLVSDTPIFFPQRLPFWWIVMADGW